MRHTTCRRSLARGDRPPRVAAHLERCSECRAFSRELEQVDALAHRLSVPAAPEGLADRVLAHVRAATSEEPTVAPAGLGPRRRAEERWAMRRRPVLASLAAAASLLLLVGVLATVTREGGPAGDDVTVDPLLTAAERTLDAGTARVRLSGSVSITVTRPEGVQPELPELELFEVVPPVVVEPPAPPDLSEVPQELRAQLEQAYDDLRRQFEEFSRQQEDLYAQLREQGADVLDLVQVPTTFRVEMAVTGGGEVAFPDRLHLEGSLEVVSAEPGLPEAPGSFEVVVVEGTAYYRGSDGRWLEVPGPSGPFGPFVLDPDGVADLLGGARPGAEDLGEEDLEGERVRHHRYGVDAGVFDPGTSTAIDATADVWVGSDDGRVRQLRVASTARHEAPDGTTVEMTTTLTLRLSDFGLEVSIEPPAQADLTGSTSTPLGPGAVFFPFDRGFSAGFHVGFRSGFEAP